MRSRPLFGIVGSAMLAIGCAQSDVGITTSVKSQLVADDLVKARRIDVDTQDRVVTLTGDVRSAEEEARALQIARDTNGVADVVDQISVLPEPQAAPTTGGPLTSDASITAEVKSRLLVDPDISGLRIDVDTSNGMVTLTGMVTTQAEKSEALEIARRVEGVTNVTDRIAVGRQ